MQNKIIYIFASAQNKFNQKKNFKYWHIIPLLRKTGAVEAMKNQYIYNRRKHIFYYSDFWNVFKTDDLIVLGLI